MTFQVPTVWCKHGFNGFCVECHKESKRDIKWQEYPKLLELWKKGYLFIEGDSICAYAADGSEVQVGDITHLKQTEQYLIDHPTPDKW